MTAHRTSCKSGRHHAVQDFSKKLESVLAFTIDQATAGVRLPSVRIPSVAETWLDGTTRIDFVTNNSKASSRSQPQAFAPVVNVMFARLRRE